MTINKEVGRDGNAFNREVLSVTNGKLFKRSVIALVAKVFEILPLRILSLR